MKVLFISFVGSDSYSGGKQCSQRNLSSLEVIYGKENVISFIFEEYPHKNFIIKLFYRIINVFRMYMGGVTRKRITSVLKIVEEENIDLVFVDSSLLGVIVQAIKTKYSQVRVVTYFHNCEYNFCKDHVFVKKDYIRFYWILLAYFNERKVVRYSDKTICLNIRDYDDITNLYKRTPDAIIPISFMDVYNGMDHTFPILTLEKKALFVGSYFFANIEGIKWFIVNVFPHVNIELSIVGAGMGNLGNNLREIPKNIHIYDTVPDLTPFYLEADFVILPIFSGSGMKVKTAESLMYGKYILGTDEAFMGYEVGGSYAIRCNTQDDFIRAIENTDFTRYSAESRNLFLSKYSFEATLSLFKRVLY